MEYVWDKWESFPRTPGVYVVYSGRPIHRLRGVDSRGILYIGKSTGVRDRLWEFYYIHHPASAFLWVHLPVARIVLGSKMTSKKAVEVALGKLAVRVATPLARIEVDRAERSLLFAYMYEYGESPPLNLTLPGRWKKRPSGRGLQWARSGIFVALK
jgi:hypothetical protein